MCEHKYVSDFIAKKMASQEQTNGTTKSSNIRLKNALKEASLRITNENDDCIVLLDSHNNQLFVNKKDKTIISGGRTLFFDKIKALFELYKTEGWL